MDSRKTGLILGLGALVILALIGLITLSNRSSKTSSSNTSPAPSPSQSSSSSTTSSNLKTTDQPAVTETGPRNVLIQSFSFSPASLTIKKGTIVTWTNQDSVGHTVTADTKSSSAPDSPLLEQGQQYSFTFNTVGTFAYHCTPHPNMKGTVIVTE